MKRPVNDQVTGKLKQQRRQNTGRQQQIKELRRQ